MRGGSSLEIGPSKSVIVAAANVALALVLVLIRIRWQGWQIVRSAILSQEVLDGLCLCVLPEMRPARVLPTSNSHEFRVMQDF